VTTSGTPEVTGWTRPVGRVATMPQPKKAAPPPDDPRSTLEALRTFLLLPRERVRETLDDAVRRGRITRADAEELVDRFMELGRQQSDDVLARLESLVPGGGTVGRAVRGLKGDGSASGFPIDGYDDLTAAQINGRLDGLSPVELRQVRDYEKKNANRKSVLNAVEKRLQ
jgi:hypothetical protein